MRCMKNDEQLDRDEDWVQFLGVRRAWVGTALFMFCILISIYSGMAMDYHLSKGWNGYETMREIVADTTRAIPTAAAIPVVILFLGVEVPMILYSLVKERIEKRQRRREAIGEARGIELERRKWMEWDARREAAKAAGEEFTEPNPVAKHNGEPRDK